jgi:hypothetical protein
MKKKYIIIILILAAIGTWSSCKNSYLDIKPAGSLDQSVLSNTKGCDALLIGCYSLLDGWSISNTTWGPQTSNWVYGDIRGLESIKGSTAIDQPDINGIATFSETPTNGYLNEKWRLCYEGVSRCNNAINIVNSALKAGTIDQTQTDTYIEQLRALRGWYHFEAWRMWGKIPYLDETTNTATVSNDVDVRPMIIADFQEGVKLPLNMGAVGKFNKTVCQVFLAKAMMQMNHDYTGALPILQAASTGTKPNGAPIGLAPTYGEVFDIVNRNGIEAIYTVQYSVNDGSGGTNGGYGEVLNFPYKSGGSPGGCCGFFNPSQEFVNSFRTSGGLPLLDNSYNNDPVISDEGLDKAPLGLPDPFVTDKGPLDPRLDWSVGRRGIPYWDWGLHTGADWIRDQTADGPYSPKKQVYKKSQEGQFTDKGNWTGGFTANGYRMIRYADLLLLIAECQIETGDLVNAQININLIRARAANSVGWVKMPDGTNAANYQISQYTTPFADKAYAESALYMERKLELGQEGHRWFDLNRWGITVTELNRALNYEKTMPWGGVVYGSATVGAEDVTYPIPQRQLDLSNGKLTQNR